MTTAGIRKLRKILIGAEATTDPGTEVNATTYLRYTGVPEDARETVHPDEDVGYLWGVDRSYASKQLGIFQIQGEATFEQLPYFLNAGIMGTTPTTDSGSGYIWTYTLPQTDTDPVYTYTLEGGDNIEAEVMTYGFIPEMTLSGEVGQSWMIDATWNGRTIASSSFTTGLSLPTVTEMLFTKTKLYIDPTTDTIGTTQITNTIINANLSLSLWRPVWTADGNLYFSFVKCSQPEATLQMTFEHNSSAIAQKALWRLNTARLIRLKCEGAALSSSGTYTYKTLIIDLAGSWVKFDKLDEVDGNDVIGCEFKVGYNSTYAKAGQIIVVNELSALP